MRDFSTRSRNLRSVSCTLAQVPQFGSTSTRIATECCFIASKSVLPLRVWNDFKSIVSPTAGPLCAWANPAQKTMRLSATMVLCFNGSGHHGASFTHGYCRVGRVNERDDLRMTSRSRGFTGISGGPYGTIFATFSCHHRQKCSVSCNNSNRSQCNSQERRGRGTYSAGPCQADTKSLIRILTFLDKYAHFLLR